jgi:hypothetical protein
MARSTALDLMDRAERNYRLALGAAVVVELLFLAGFLVLADFSNRLHLLLLLATLAVYSITAAGLLALGAHVRRNTLRVLQAVELLGSRLKPQG